MKIGTKYLTYSERRYLDGKFPDFPLARVIDHGVVLNSLSQRLLQKTDLDQMNFHSETGLNRTGGYHLWNGASNTHKPWISSFELPIPWNFPETQNWRYLGNANCRAVIFRSNWTRDISEKLLGGDEDWNAIRDKSFVLPSAEAVKRPDPPVKPGRQIRFIFVGRDFYRKGGLQFLEAFSRVARRIPDVHLTIVSRMSLRDWPLPPTATEVGFAQRLLRECGDQVTLFGELAHADVYEEVSRCHVGVCASPIDTLGNSIVEFMASGLPVIISNIAGHPELIGDDAGWRVDLPVDENRVLDRSTYERRSRIASILTDGLESTIESIVRNPAEIPLRGLNAMDRIRRNHSPEAVWDRIHRLYRAFQS